MFSHISANPYAAKFSQDFHNVVPFDPLTDKVSILDLSPANQNFTKEVYATEIAFDAFITSYMDANKAKYLIGGYGETRNMYLRSKLFDSNLQQNTSLTEEPRNLHLGVDIWGPAGTSVMTPLGGMVHSMANNDNFGDYGPTIILQHQIDMFNFYTLYGHMAIDDLKSLRVGQFITRGETFAHFGDYAENGNWPPHLHFQVIVAINEWEGDYPGVCKASEAGNYLANCPNPDLILKLEQYAS